MIDHRSLAALLVAAATFVAPAARANASGLLGYSGKPNVSAPQGASCGSCHTGGEAPVVTIAGPDAIAAGGNAEYTLTVTTTMATRAGAGVAATDGVGLLSVQNQGLRDTFGEVVQNGARMANNGVASFRFRVTVPKNLPTIKLWAVGVGANGDGVVGGDAAMQTTKDIAITGFDPNAPPIGAGPIAADGGTTGDPAAPGGSGDPNDPSADEPSSGTRGQRSKVDPDNGWGCSTLHRSQRNGSELAIYALAGVLGLALARRRRRA